MMEIPAGRHCDICPLDHVWENTTPNGDETYACSLFPTEPHREEDYRNPSCLLAYPYGGTVTITAKGKS